MTEGENLTTADLAQRKDDEGSTRQQGEADERAEPEQRGEETLEPLLPADHSDRYRQRWNELQSRFVDEPRDTVEKADGLVAELMQDLAGSFSDTRSSLEEQWTRGDDVSTEDLRVALQRYRSFFERLLSA